MRDITPVISNPWFITLTNRWNETFHLEIINLSNFILGLTAALVGGVIFVQSIRREEKEVEPVHRAIAAPSIQWNYIAPRLIGALLLFGALLAQLGNHDFSSVSIIFWLASLLTFSLLFWKREHDSSADLRLNLDWLDGAWMFLLFALGIGIGAYLLRDIPTYLIPDEGSFWETARSIATKEYQPSFFDFGVYSFPVASSIFQGWVARLTGINLWGWRFSSVLAASLSIYPLYMLARELFNRRLAIAACVVMIANPYYLAFARLGYNNSQSLFPVLLAVYFLVIGLRGKRFFYLWLAGLSAGLGFYTYFSSWLGLIVVVTMLVMRPFNEKKNFRSALPAILVVLAGWLVVVLPRIVYGLSGDLDTSLYYKVLETSFVSGFYGRATFGEMAINQVATWKVGQTEVFFSVPYYGIFLVRGLVRSIAALFVPDLYRDHFIVSELLGPGNSLFFIFGLGIAIFNARKTRYLVLNLWFWLGLIFLSALGAFPPRPTHMVAMIPAMSLLTALGLTVSLEAIIGRIPFLQIRRILFERIATGFTLCILVLMGCSVYFKQMPLEYTADFDRVASWLARKASGPSTLVFVEETPSPHDAAYQGQTKLTGHYVLSVTPAELQTIPGAIKERDFMVFVDADNETNGIIPALEALFPQANSQKISNSAGTALGFVVSNMPIEVKWNINLSDGLRDLWASPARFFILVSIFMAVCMAFIALAKNWRVLEAEPSTQNMAVQTYQYEKQTRWPALEIEFRLHIRIPRPVKNEPRPPESAANDSDPSGQQPS